MLVLCLCYDSVVLLLCLFHDYVMLLVCFCCASVMLMLLLLLLFMLILLLLFYYASVILPLKRNSNTIFFIILRYPHIFTDEYVTKELLIEAMFCSNKRKCIEIFPQGVSIITCLRSVQESGYVLGKI